VVVVARVGGLVPALAAAVAAAVLLDHYFVPPLYDFDVADPTNVVALVAFVLVAGAVGSVVGLAARRAREAETLATANAASREELRVLADEQAALRRVLAEEQAALWRVATLVGGGWRRPRCSRPSRRRSDTSSAPTPRPSPASIPTA
jgi:two-component system sensor histidine kinase KdpD